MERGRAHYITDKSENDKGAPPSIPKGVLIAVLSLLLLVGCTMLITSTTASVLLWTGNKSVILTLDSVSMSILSNEVIMGSQYTLRMDVVLDVGDVNRDVAGIVDEIFEFWVYFNNADNTSQTAKQVPENSITSAINMTVGGVVLIPSVTTGHDLHSTGCGDYTNLCIDIKTKQPNKLLWWTGANVISACSPLDSCRNQITCDSVRILPTTGDVDIYTYNKRTFQFDVTIEAGLYSACITDNADVIFGMDMYLVSSENMQLHKLAGRLPTYSVNVDSNQMIEINNVHFIDYDLTGLDCMEYDHVCIDVHPTGMTEYQWMWSSGGEFMTDCFRLTVPICQDIMWFSATDVDNPGTWVYADGTALPNTGIGQAPASDPLKHCSITQGYLPTGELRWIHERCNSVHKFVCQYNDTAASSPISALRVVKKDNSACTNVCASKGPSRIFTQTNASHTPKRFGIPNKENNEVDSSCVSTLKQPPVHLDSVSYADVAKRLTPKLPRTSAAELALGNYPSRSASATSLAMGSSRSSSNMMSRLASVDAFSSGTPSTSNTARSSKASNLTNTATRSSMSRLQRSNTFNKAVHTINDTTNVHSSSSTRFSMVNVYTKTQNSKNQSTVATSLPSLSRNSDFAIEGVCPLRSPSLSPSVPPHIVASGDLTSPDSLSTTFTCGSPVGTGQKMSYAQVVSTPQRVSPRTPLSCISNSPVPFNLDVEIMPSKQEKKDACNTRPDKSTSAFGFKRLKPTYMMMTKSAASKRKGHRRSLSSGDITSLPAGRVPKIKGSASSRMSKPSLSRSRSYGNLHR
uniref:Uncharacterized protein LOC100375727 n=1 Tax=Saccoglossus kowalevskii TaxID=10224 RepID=A0ABM0GTU5_SACKO|nr:PREDICTED: uncharacterized protein LOC100375727 [Saccoglossus kowalevskii]